MLMGPLSIKLPKSDKTASCLHDMTCEVKRINSNVKVPRAFLSRYITYLVLYVGKALLPGCSDSMCMTIVTHTMTSFVREGLEVLVFGTNQDHELHKSQHAKRTFMG